MPCRGSDWNDNCNMNRWECEDCGSAGGFCAVAAAAGGGVVVVVMVVVGLVVPVVVIVSGQSPVFFSLRKSGQGVEMGEQVF